MKNSANFDRLTAAGNPLGEVIGVSGFLITLKGLQPCSIHALVLFDDGSKGFVYTIEPDHVQVLHLGSEPLTVGSLAVVQHQELVCRVGKDFIGRVVSVTGQPLDGKGPIASDSVRKVFGDAPKLYERELLDTQLETGIAVIDTIFPVVRGQRMSLLGDSKSGKSTLATQLTINQRDTDQVVVYALIAKRRDDIDMLIKRLEENGALNKAIIVVSTLFESPISSYLLPYVACAMAEHLWQDLKQDTIIIYDDLTSHAHVCREVALLAGKSPGRDSYPGNMFYLHSSLLERAGRLKVSGKHLTCIPLVTAAGGDITAYLPTNIMSITDGQWILDMEIFRKGLRPAVNIGLSVTRVGNIGFNKRQKQLSIQAIKVLAEYRQAEEFSHFGSELALESRAALNAGRRLMTTMTQGLGETFSLIAQQLMFDIVLNLEDGVQLDIEKLKKMSNQVAAKATDDKQYESAREELKKYVLVELKK